MWSWSLFWINIFIMALMCLIIFNGSDSFQIMEQGGDVSYSPVCHQSCLMCWFHLDVQMKTHMSTVNKNWRPLPSKRFFWIWVLMLTSCMIYRSFQCAPCFCQVDTWWHLEGPHLLWASEDLCCWSLAFSGWFSIGPLLCHFLCKGS